MAVSSRQDTVAALPRDAAIGIALLRISLGLIYLWAFITQAFGVVYANHDGAKPPSYGWNFAADPQQGWISSGFTHSPTAMYVGGTHGPLAFLPKGLPTVLDDIGWMVAIAGLGVALTLGIAMRIAGWGGFALNVLLWLATFPPSSNPIIDGTHTIYALLLLTLTFLGAGDHWGLGRWWTSHTPAFLH